MRNLLAIAGLLSLLGTNGAFALDAESQVSDFSKLRKIAESSLRYNIIALKSGNYLRAGSHQYQSLWTRDFGFATRGLFNINRADVVRDQVSLILNHIRESDNLVPRYLDSVMIRKRYVYLFFGINVPIKDPLKAEYKGGGATDFQTIDSNALTLLAAVDYLEKTGDWAWWSAYLPKMIRAFRFYERFIDPEDGLIFQGPFADWQDSVNRQGKTVLMNLLYYRLLERLARYPEFGVDVTKLPALKETIIRTFLDPETGLYRSIAGEPYIGLDANLLVIDFGFHPPGSPEAEAIYANLQRHPLWSKNNGIAGYPTYPNYPKKWRIKNISFAGMGHYHDSFYWSWLMGLSAKVAFLMNDRASGDLMLENLERIATRDGVIAELFEPKPPFKKVRTWLYHTELPFSWGSAFILDAISAR